MAVDVDKAKRYIESVDLSGTPRGIVGQDAATDASVVFDQAKNQAQIVGSGLFSFEQGVDARVREAISDSALLAQLHASKQVKFEIDPQAWFGAYAEVLGVVGWTVQDFAWNDYSTDGTDVEVNEKIIDLLTVALGPSPAAAALVMATMKALKAMTPNSPWITLFSREVQRGKIARFQAGLVNTDPAGDVFVTLVATIIVAKNSISQVLFFKWKEAKASFQAGTQKVSINRPALTDLGPSIRQKIRAYQLDYLSSIKDI